MRDLDVNPYSKDEERVVKWLDSKGLGGGDDPIGFIMASYEYIMYQLREEKRINQFMGL